MRYIHYSLLLISLTLNTTIYADSYTTTRDSDNIPEIVYEADMGTGELRISRGNETKIVPNIVGYTGQTSRTLVTFNGGPALIYENAGSNTLFEVFYTLTFKGEAPLIDCLYGNIRNGRNGVSIRKGVCNLQEPLSSQYQDLIYTYSNQWIEATNSVSLQAVMAEPSQAVDVPIDRLGGIDLALRYSSAEELMSASPTTIAKVDDQIYEITTGNAYFIYDADGTTPFAMDVERDPATRTFKRITSKDLLRAIKSSGDGFRIRENVK
ncbi:hypothetical protein [Pseudomonas sp. DNDY-54]|uniref:hypothetical protein n=1 Tax=Pseudomonas sp. DNDY-54 TaxID=2870860 RepID=UPI001CA437C0|nr:hypothetical protein [Pseudomonas sp. DNDY-54]